MFIPFEHVSLILCSVETTIKYKLFTDKNISFPTFPSNFVHPTQYSHLSILNFTGFRSIKHQIGEETF